MALTKISGSILKDPLNLGEVSIGGTLTYQDVTNVDALGIGTFRSGINVSGGQLDVGSNIKLGNAGVITATSFVGSGANLTGITQTTINNNADNRVITGSGTANTLEAESTLTFSSRRLTSGGLTLNDDGVGGNIFQLYADDHNPWTFAIGNTTYHASSGLLGQQSNNGDFLLRMVGNSEYKSFVIEQHNGSSNRSWIELGNGGTVNLCYQGSTKLGTAADRVNITGHIFITDGSRLYMSNGFGNGHATIRNEAANTAGNMVFSTRTAGGSDTSRAMFTTDGHFIPYANNTYDLGNTATRWRNIYTNDLNLSNEGSSNDVDGTWGNYTIQEGEDDLFLINRRSGKKYKFNLTEVS